MPGEFFRGPYHAVLVPDGKAAEHFHFGNVRRDDRAERQKLCYQRFHGFLGNQSVSAGGNHDRIDYDVFGIILPELMNNNFDTIPARYHADFYGVGGNIGKNAVELLRDKFRRRVHDGVYPGGVLGGQRRDHAHGVHFVRGNGFDIRLDAGSPAGIRAGDRKKFFHAEDPPFLQRTGYRGQPGLGFPRHDPLSGQKRRLQGSPPPWRF